MKKILLVLCILLAIKATVAFAVPPPGGESVLSFAGEDWRIYFGGGGTGFNTADGNFFTQHSFTEGDGYGHDSKITFATYADQSKVLSFDWSIESLLTPTPTSYGTFFESQILGLDLFDGLIYPNEIYSGHAEVIISEGLFYTLRGFSNNYFGTPGHEYIIHTRLNNLTITPLKEPQTLLLLLFGMICFLLNRSIMLCHKYRSCI